MTEIAHRPVRRVGGASVPTVDLRRVFLVAAILTMGFLAVAIDRGVAERASGLFWRAAENEWRAPPGSALLLYLRLPTAILGAGMAFLGPGLLLSLALGWGDDAARWITGAVAASLGLAVIVTFATAAVGAADLAGGHFLGLWALVAAAALGTLLARTRLVPPPWPIRDRTDRLVLALSIALPLGFVVACLPKFLWASLNGDGVEAWFVTLQLLRRPVPFLGAEAGPAGWFPPIDAMLFAYPASWFVRLLGPLELSIRLPFLIGMAGLLSSTVAHFTHRSLRRPAIVGAAALAVLSCSLILAYTATQNPYTAEPGVHGPQFLLLMTTFLGLALAFEHRMRGWMVLFATLSLVVSPAGGMLIAFWLAATILLRRPRAWASIVTVALVLLAGHLAARLGGELLRLLDLPAPVGGGYDLLEAGRRWRFVQIEDWTRLRYLLIPAGVLPGLALFDWRRLDGAARPLAVAALAYFVPFYLQATVSVHHFAPAMILPLAVAAGSSRLGSGSGMRWWTASWYAGGLVAVWLALPDHPGVSVVPRRVAGSIADRATGYEALTPTAYSQAELLEPLFALPWDPRVPGQLYGVSPLVNLHYACRGPACTGKRPYLLTDARDMPSSVGARVVARSGNLELHVLDHEAWQRDRAIREPSPAGSRFYALPRGAVFHGLPGGPRSLDLESVLRRLPID